MKNKEKKEKDKRLLTMLVLFFPTVLIVAVSSIQDPIYRTVLQLLLAFYQLITMKNLMDEYYG